MSQFTDRDFFGGAIRGVVPQRWMDASDLREIPDHQELFLSPETLSSLIIEVNQRVSDEEARSAFTGLLEQDPSLADIHGTDEAAALYHLRDLLEEGDGFHVTTPPMPVNLDQLSSNAPSGSTVAAYKGTTDFRSVTRQRGPPPPAGIVNGDSHPAPRSTMLSCHYLLVRLAAQETDILVFFNVPHEEFYRNGDTEGLVREGTLADETIQALEEKLEIQDWNLFV